MISWLKRLVGIRPPGEDFSVWVNTETLMSNPDGTYRSLFGDPIQGVYGGPGEDDYPSIETLFSPENLAAGPLHGSVQIVTHMKRWRWVPGEWKRTTIYPVVITSPGVVRMTEDGPEFSVDMGRVDDPTETWTYLPWEWVKSRILPFFLSRD